jgi:hypothetical protein
MEKKKVSTIFFCAIFLTAVFSGCNSVGIYFQDRALDFADCFKADIGIGYGLDAHLVFTDFLVPGVGASHTWKIGFKGRNVGA